MLIKLVNHGGTKKYVKLEEAIFSHFVSAVQQKFLIPENTVLKVTGEQGIEIDEDVFPEIAAVKDVCFVFYTDDDILPVESSKDLTANSNLTEYVTHTPCDLAVLPQESEWLSSQSLTDTLSVSSSLSSLSSDTSDAGYEKIQPLMDSTHARNTVEQILTTKSAGVTVLKEYEETGSLKDSSRRFMANIIVAHMREKEGRAVSKAAKEFHALGIVSLFPSLKDPYSKKGYEHFYDIESNKGFLEWRVKTMQRQSKTTSMSHNRVELKGGPTSSRTFVSIDGQQIGDECVEAVSLLRHTTDCDLVYQKIKETFHCRQKMLHDPEQSADILEMFPRFLDTKGLILQDFLLMFGVETASRFLEKWNMSFKDKIIQEASDLKETPLLKKTSEICPESRIQHCR